MFILASRALISKQLFLLCLSCWICALAGEKKKLISTSISAGSAQNTPSSVPNYAGEARQSKKPPTNAGSFEIENDEDLPTWIVVLIIVISGFVVVACCLCAIRIHRWKKDQGTYSMWNDRELNVEAMCFRESGVVFEKLDIDSNLSEAQCYEIPVDSFVTPQRVYVGGSRVTVEKEGIEDSIRSTEQRMSETGKRLASVDDIEYLAVLDRFSHASDSTSKRESKPNSANGDISRHSSVSHSTSSLSERAFSPGSESPSKQSYTKPLPQLPKIVSEEPELCEIYKLNGTNGVNQERVSALVHRPLPQTPSTSPPLSPPLAVGSSVSLDRSLLRQVKNEKLQKPNVTFRTLPRPRKIRQLPIPKPLLNKISRSASSNDVTKETRLHDHVACEPNDCTLTRIKKRMSQSLDTLFGTQRSSHFYENPYLMSDDENIPVAIEDTDGKGNPETLSVPVDPPYASVSSPGVSDEDLPRNKEHLYARISSYMDSPDVNLNRHSYASIHYPGRVPSPVFPRPKSRHTYISIVFGSADSVFEQTSEGTTDSGAAKSHSCSDLTSVRESPLAVPDGSTCKNKGTKNSYVNVNEVCNGEESFPKIRFCAPRKSTKTLVNGSGSKIPKANEVNSRTDKTVQDARNGERCSKHLVSFPQNVKHSYENVNKALNTPFSEGQQHTSTSTVLYQNLGDVRTQPHYQNVRTLKKDSGCESNFGGSTEPNTYDYLPPPRKRPVRSSASSDSSDSHYGVPKSPAVSLKRVREILRRTSDSVDNNHNGAAINGFVKLDKDERKTFSSYLEDRFGKGLELQDASVPLQVTGNTQAVEPVQATKPVRATGFSLVTSFPETVSNAVEESGIDENAEHVYENFIAGTRQSCTSEDSLSNRDRLSSTGSSLSIDEKDTYENQPLISRNVAADVNGNSVCDGGVEKSKLRSNNLAGNALSGESVA